MSFNVKAQQNTNQYCRGIDRKHNKTQTSRGIDRMGVQVKSAMSSGDLGGHQSPHYKPTESPKKSKQQKKGKKLDYAETSNGAADKSSLVTHDEAPLKQRNKKEKGFRCVASMEHCCYSAGCMMF